MINQYKLLHLFLLVVPFFNIISHKTSILVVILFSMIFVLINICIYKPVNIENNNLHTFSMLLILIILLFVSQLHSLVYLNKSNFNSIRFFGMFLPFTIYFILYYDFSKVAAHILKPILTFYIYVYSLSICIDYFILHSSFDISLQPMYHKDDWNYMGRPFGITGQPSVNSVLLVFFYCFLISFDGIKISNTKVLFMLVTIGIFLQGSGSGFVAILTLYYAMLKRANYLIRYFLYALAAYFIILFAISLEIFNKISIEYITGISRLFYSQIEQWLDLIEYNFYSSLFFGGTSSGIDFGPLYLVSNVGMLYFISLMLFFLYLAIISKNYFERMSLIIILVGNLHYPVMFYLAMAFMLPLFALNILNNNFEKRISKDFV